MISDVARKADIRLPSGRLRDIANCTRWNIVTYDCDKAKNVAKARILNAHSSELDEDGFATQCLPENASLVEREEIAGIAQHMKDMQSVVDCTNIHNDLSITIRFVKYDYTEQEQRLEVNSSILRERMWHANGKVLQKALQQMALSPDILRKYRSSWSRERSLDELECIDFSMISEIDNNSQCSHDGEQAIDDAMEDWDVYIADSDKDKVEIDRAEKDSGWERGENTWLNAEAERAVDTSVLNWIVSMPERRMMARRLQDE